MAVRFLNQPLGAQVGIELAALLSDPAVTGVRLCVAWVKPSVRRFAAPLAAARGRGATVHVLTGLDLGFASPDGLAALLEVTTETRLFSHSGSDRTFHPKVYIVERGTTTSVILGSSNLTDGGLFNNFEVSVVVDGLTSADPFLVDVDAYWNALWNEPGSSTPLTQAIVDSLRSDSSAVAARAIASRPTTLPSSIAAMFSASGLTFAPRPAALRTRTTGPTTSPITPAAPSTAPAGMLRMYKKLSNNDVSTRSSPGQIIIPRMFEPAFGVLPLEFDRSAIAGPTQWNAAIGGVFRDGVDTIPFQGRIVKYKPAASNRRKNTELRFTFLNKTVQSRLGTGDALLFESVPGSPISVTRVPGTAYAGKWGWL